MQGKESGVGTGKGVVLGSRNFNDVRPANAPDGRDKMGLELRAQTVVMRSGETHVANGSQGHQRREP